MANRFHQILEKAGGILDESMASEKSIPKYHVIDQQAYWDICMKSEQISLLPLPTAPSLKRARQEQEACSDLFMQT